MCVLSDADILREVEIGNLGIYPFDSTHLRPNGYDWHLGSTILEARDGFHFNEWVSHTLAEGEIFRFNPEKLYLAVTQERLTLPTNIMAQMTGRSSLGRLGLPVHITAGDFDCGFSGYGTAEIVVLGPWSIPIPVGKNIGKFVFTYTRTSASVGYDSWPGSRYTDQPPVPVISQFYVEK